MLLQLFETDKTVVIKRFVVLMSSWQVKALAKLQHSRGTWSKEKERKIVKAKKTKEKELEAKGNRGFKVIQ